MGRGTIYERIPRERASDIDRYVLIGAASGVLAGLLVGYVLSAVDPLLLEAFIIIFPGLFGAYVWLRSGFSLFAALSWTVPLASVFGIALYILPTTIAWVVHMLGVGFVGAMLFYEPLIEWWLGRVNGHQG